MKIDIITIFPHMFDNIFGYGIIHQALRRKLVSIKTHDLRNFAKDKQVDDRPFGGGPGMILKAGPLFKAIESLRKKSSHVVFLTPQGKTLNQKKTEQLSKLDHLILICGRYEGIDQRVRDHIIDEEISIGRYVLSGGEIPAMALVDSVVRLIPGTIKNEEFNINESFSDLEDRLRLDYPQYTRPSKFREMEVPEVLLSGNHEKIANWRKRHSPHSN